MGPLTAVVAPVAAVAPVATNSNATQDVITGTPIARRASSTSRSRSAGGGSSLGESRSRSREHGLRPTLGMTIAAAVAAAVVPARNGNTSTKAAALRGKAKFSLGRAGNRRLAVRRNSAGLTARGKTKQKDEEEEEVDEDVDDAEDDNQDLAAAAEAEAERERHFAQEQARRAVRAEEEKQRRRDAERQQRQLETAAALDAPTADNASETSSKRPVRFNIGSHSDDGAGGKSAGSGSDASAAVQGTSDNVNGKGKERAMEDAVEQQQVAQQHYGQQVQQLPQIPPPAYPPQQEPHPQLPTAIMSKSQMRQLERLQQVRQYHVGAAPQQLHQARPPVAGPSRQEPTTEEKTAAASGLASPNIRKGKQREVAVTVAAAPNAVPLNGVGAGVDDAMLAKVKQSLNEPLLPTGKTRVQVMTESEFETTDDEADDGEWSSAELTADDEELVRLLHCSSGLFPYV